MFIIKYYFFRITFNWTILYILFIDFIQYAACNMPLEHYFKYSKYSNYFTKSELKCMKLAM